MMSAYPMVCAIEALIDVCYRSLKGGECGGALVRDTALTHLIGLREHTSKADAPWLGGAKWSAQYSNGLGVP